MAKRGRPKASERDDKSVKLDRTVVEQAQLVARARRVTLAEYLTELIRVPVERAYRQEVKNLAAKIEE
jgi:hypothetical protein